MAHHQVPSWKSAPCRFAEIRSQIDDARQQPAAESGQASTSPSIGWKVVSEQMEIWYQRTDGSRSCSIAQAQGVIK